MLCAKIGVAMTCVGGTGSTCTGLQGAIRLRQKAQSMSINAPPIRTRHQRRKNETNRPRRTKTKQIQSLRVSCECAVACTYREHVSKVPSIQYSTLHHVKPTNRRWALCTSSNNGLTVMSLLVSTLSFIDTTDTRISSDLIVCQPNRLFVR